MTVFMDIDALVPQDHLLRKIENVMDYDWLYERLDPYYCHDNARPGTDPVVFLTGKENLLGMLREAAKQQIESALSTEKKPHFRAN